MSSSTSKGTLQASSNSFLVILSSRNFPPRNGELIPLWHLSGSGVFRLLTPGFDPGRGGCISVEEKYKNANMLCKVSAR